MYHFRDAKPVPDQMFRYAKDLKDAPLIVDNGSYNARVGWASEKEPRMVFKNLITKVKKEKSRKDLETQVGNDIVSIEAGRLNLKTQFDRGIVTHFEAQETLLDYALTHIGINTAGSVQHRIVFSEPVANPNFSRGAMSELLFECYGVPAVSYYVDALSSLRHNQPDAADALVVSCGHHATHVIPVIDGRMDAPNTRRINIGGFLMCSFLQRLLQLKSPALTAAITLSRAEEILHNLTRFACDYPSELSHWSDRGICERQTTVLQLPVNAAAAAAAATAGPSRDGELTHQEHQPRDRKREAQARMLEMHRKKRQALVDELETRLAELQDSGDPPAERLTEEVAAVQARLEVARAKLADIVNKEREPVRLPPEDLQQRVKTLQDKRRVLLDRRAERRLRRADMSRRRTAASQQRMRIISQLAQKEKKDDTFGMRDEDWDLYKSINKEGGDSDSEAEREELAEVESRLRQLAPDLLRQHQHTGSLGELYQIQLTSETIRVPEILFQPSVLGLDQAGLAETIDFVLKKYPAEQQLRLAGNVYVTGGVANIPGLKQRLERELLEMRPFQSRFSVSVAGCPSLDSWRGAQEVASRGGDELRYLSRAEYLEFGAEYLAVHRYSNPYHATPAAGRAAGP